MKNRIKKIPAVFLSIAGMVFFILAVHLQTAHAAARDDTASTAVILDASGTADEKDFSYEVLTDGTIEITQYDGFDTKLMIPAEIDGRQVSAIRNMAFTAAWFQSVIIPDGVKSIGNSSFGLCDDLTDIELPDSVKSIGNWTFHDCSSLKSITIPDSVTSMGFRDFDSCSSLKSVTLSKNLTKIGVGSFSDCRQLKSITIPQKVTAIEVDAFNNCGRLSDVYYFGTMKQWTKIKIESGNSIFNAVTLHCRDGVIQSSALKNPAPQKITFKPDKVKNGKAEYGVSFSLHAQSSGNGKLSYKSSNSKILSVSAAGKVKAKGIGSASITVTAAGTAGYKSASRTLKLIVVPKQVQLKEWSVANDGIFCRWASVPQADGYEFSMAQDSQFSNPTTVKWSKSSITIGDIYTKEDALYFRVRAYKKAGGKIYYGKWSDARVIRHDSTNLL